MSSKTSGNLADALQGSNREAVDVVHAALAAAILRLTWAQSSEALDWGFETLALPSRVNRW